MTKEIIENIIDNFAIELSHLWKCIKIYCRPPTPDPRDIVWDSKHDFSTKIDFILLQ